MSAENGAPACQYDGCLAVAVMSCTGTTLSEEECVTYRCADHFCPCPSGVKTTVIPPASGEGPADA